MLQETLQILTDRGYTQGAFVNRDALASESRAMLLEQPVEGDTLEEIEQKALIITEIRHKIIGDAESEEVEKELDLLFTQVLASEGKVQDSLENGYVLCAAQVSRKLEGPQSPIVIRRRGRFVTSNPTQIQTYFWGPAEAKLHKSMATMARHLELAVRRQPLLEPAKPLLVAKAHTEIQLQLPVGTS